MIRERLEQKLKPLYADLLKNIKSNQPLYAFCMQWGASFPEAENEGIFFVGKATNGWLKPLTHENDIFGDT